MCICTYILSVFFLGSARFLFMTFLALLVLLCSYLLQVQLLSIGFLGYRGNIADMKVCRCI